MKTLALIEMGKDGSYSVFTPNIGSMIYGEGKTVSEAKADFENTYNEMILFASQDNEPLPESLQNLSFNYKYDLASFFEHYSVFNVSALAKRIGINAALMRQYKQGNTYISENQLQKIENGIHKLGQELLNLNLV